MKPQVLEGRVGTKLDGRLDEIIRSTSVPVFSPAFQWSSFFMTLFFGCGLGSFGMLGFNLFRNGVLFSHNGKFQVLLGILSITLLAAMQIMQYWTSVLEQEERKEDTKSAQAIKLRLRAIREQMDTIEGRAAALQLQRGNVVSVKTARRSRGEAVSILRKLVTTMEGRLAEIETLLTSKDDFTLEQAMEILEERVEIRTNLVDPILDRNYMLVVRADELPNLLSGLLHEIEESERVAHA